MMTKFAGFGWFAGHVKFDGCYDYYCMLRNAIISQPCNLCNSTFTKPLLLYLKSIQRKEHTMAFLTS